MPKIDDTGVYQLSNGYWAFRYVVTVNNKRVERKRNKDEQGNPFKTKMKPSYEINWGNNFPKEKAAGFPCGNQRPNSLLYFTFIPKSNIRFTVSLTISFGNLNSGIPCTNNPPK